GGTSAPRPATTRPPTPQPRPSSPQTRSAARTPAAPHARAQAGPVTASAAATPDPPPTADVHPPAGPAIASYRVPSHTSVIEVLRRSVESALPAGVVVVHQPGQAGHAVAGAGPQGVFEGIQDQGLLSWWWRPASR